MPMIDIHAPAEHRSRTRMRWRRAAAATLMRIEGVPDIPMFRDNTAAFSSRATSLPRSPM